MKKSAILLSIIFSLGNIIHSQEFTDSNLPIIVINTDQGATIPDAPRIFAIMKIIYNGPNARNYLSDQNRLTSLNYNGRINIETRGSSSQMLPKKQYGFSTKKPDYISNNNVSLLGMPSENDWILNGLAYDSSYIRDYLSYNLSRNIGSYASRTVFCELVLNGSYKGLYVLQEKIKVDDNRVDIVKMDTVDNAGNKVTGGYITKIDKATGTGTVAWKRSSYIGTNDLHFLHEFPDFDEITPAQHSYIQSQFDKLDSAATAKDTSITHGYPSLIDVTAFIDYLLINELAANADAYQNSAFFHKERRGKLKAGPVWDMNLTYGNELPSWQFKRSQTNVWQFANGDNEGPRFWKDLYNEPKFRCYLAKRWNQLTQPGMPLHITRINTVIDIAANTIYEAVPREKALWSPGNNHGVQITKIKNFIRDRMAWMTTTLGSFEACNNVSLPPLVITKIMYNPYFSQQEEFIEIKNTGSTEVPLTGVFFSNTGFGYQFPVGATLAPGKTFMLASDRSSFYNAYGFNPDGEYSRNLSNSGQAITLSDAYGNIIDHVSYSDKEPWPYADGNGAFLKLKADHLDNNIGTNWVTESPLTLSLEHEKPSTSLQLYPSPARSVVNVSSSAPLGTILVYDLQGQLLLSHQSSGNVYALDISSLNEGTYVVKCVTQNESLVQKIIKE